MEKELPEFLQILKEKDPDYARSILDNYEKRFSDEALSAKTKTLIALALDAANGDVEGVKALAKRAKEQGATEDELLEVVEIVEGTRSFQGLAVGIKALD
ncbi:hypothetical protein AKJ38_03500 [candidate division MSBL1 archaeon SCGC-AAA259I14]|uniref:Carboxymuconolactone decarboxylase-like domain-containing protein n=1 Tax=candidate division MSBL1 archaeon SCGC-AAA259I14 TaxID=1698268 RepID=A0A133UPZ2_9EURY|nr:hypothetical protein AKJ38_03500 [candidate division MSBL1 archaeon SCGC-AAA259I14]